MARCTHYYQLGLILEDGETEKGLKIKQILFFPEVLSIK
jgi:hypothetical protein